MNYWMVKCPIDGARCLNYIRYDWTVEWKREWLYDNWCLDGIWIGLKLVVWWDEWFHDISTQLVYEFDKNWYLILDAWLVLVSVWLKWNLFKLLNKRCDIDLVDNGMIRWIGSMFNMYLHLTVCKSLVLGCIDLI